MRRSSTLLPPLLAVLALLPAAPRAHAQVAFDTEPDDQFGHAVATGDFNADGEDDLAVGVPNESVGDIAAAGAVNVIYGSPGAGLTSAGNQIWHQDIAGVEGGAQAGDQFGHVIAVGDFDGDGFDDLAVGVPGTAVGGASDAGVVNVLYGSNAGLTATGDQLWHQDVAGVAGGADTGDAFGWSLATGDFDGDGRDDLAIGVPFEDVGVVAVVNAGGASVLYGSPGVGLSAVGDQFWHQDQAGVLDVAGTDELFGWSLAAGDFDGDGEDDLAVGVPGEDIVSLDAAGAVNVLYGAPGAGLTEAGDQYWHQDVGGVGGEAEEDDQFGSAVAVGDFDGDGEDDLAIGVPLESVGAIPGAGAASVLYGSPGVGLTEAGDQVWHQDTAGVEGVAEPSDRFGSSLASGDFDNDGRADLAVGVPFEDTNTGGFPGAANVLYGAAGAGLSATGDQSWHQDVAGVLDVAEISDTFGYDVASGDFDGDGEDDLAVGAANEGIGTANAAGAVNVLYGAAGAGLNATGDQFWHQDSSAPAPLADGDEPLAEAATHGPEAPVSWVLHGARPNPFTTGTDVGYDVASAGHVRLAVYDVLGREVAVLADGAHEAGRHTAVLDGRALPSGVYLVRLEAGGRVLTQRLTRVR